MWQSATAHRSKKAAMAKARNNIRACIYIRSATDEPQFKSLETQATSICAFIDAHGGWLAIRPFDATSTDDQLVHDNTDHAT